MGGRFSSGIRELASAGLGIAAAIGASAALAGEPETPSLLVPTPAVATEIAALREHAHDDDPVALSEALIALAARRLAAEDMKGAGEAMDAAVATFAGGATDARQARPLSARARVRIDAGDYPGALTDIDHAMTLLQTQAAPDRVLLGTLFYDRAKAFDAQGRNEEAEAAALRSYEIRRQALGQVQEKTADALNLYANTLTAQGRHAEADPAYRQVLGMYEVLHGPKDFHLAIVLSNLGNSLRRTGRGREANPLYRRAVSVAEVSGDKVLLAQCLTNYGWYLHTQGDGRKAEIQFRRALALALEIVGPSHPFTGVVRANIGWALNDQGDFARAEPEFAAGQALLEAGLGPDSPDIVDAMGGHAAALAALDRPDEAEALYRRIRTITTTRLAPAHPDTLSESNDYAGFLLARDRPGDALDQLRGSLVALIGDTRGGAKPGDASGRDWRNSVRGAGPLFQRRVEASWRMASAQP